MYFYRVTLWLHGICRHRLSVRMSVRMSYSGIVSQESLALASMARDDPPASSMASSTGPASSTAAAMRGKVGSEFET